MLRSAVPLRLSDGLRRVTLGVNVWLRSALGLCEGVRIVFDALRSLVPVRDFVPAVRVALRSGVPVCDREVLFESLRVTDSDRSGV